MDKRARTKPSRGLPRRSLLAGLAGVGAGLLAKPGRPSGLGERSRFRFARLALPGLPNPRPTALKRIAWELERRTSLLSVSDAVELALADAELFRHPFLVLSGDQPFALPGDNDIARLRRHLIFGGFLLIDSAEGRSGGGFDESVRKLLARMMPGELPAPIAEDHVLWKSFYVLRGAPGRIVAAPYVEGVERDRRLAVVYSQNDLGGAWARDGFGRWEHDVTPGGESQREMAFRFGVNLVMYAHCLDYKTEQAHIDYILKTRRRHR